MTETNIRTKSSFIALGGFLLAIHFVSFVLYATAASPAFTYRYGALTGLQHHLWTATVSLPAVFLIAFFERRLQRRLLPLAIKILLGIWLVAQLYVFLMIPEGKVLLDPSNVLK